MFPVDYEVTGSIEFYGIVFKDGSRYSVRADNLEVYFPCKELAEHAFTVTNECFWVAALSLSLPLPLPHMYMMEISIPII